MIDEELVKYLEAMEARLIKRIDDNFVELKLQCVEELAVKQPEIIGNLIKRNVHLAKLKDKFYKEHPDFKGHSQVVKSVFDNLETTDILIPYEELVEKSVGEIRKRINLTKKLDFDQVERPDLDKYKIEDSNGMI